MPKELPGVTKRDGDAWLLRLSAGKDPLSGKYRTATRTVHATTKKDLAQALKDFQAEVDRGLHKGSSGTVGDLIDEWLRHFSPELSPTTVQRYKALIDKHIKPAWGKTKVRKVEPKALDDYYDDLRTKAGLAPRTIRQIHAVMSRAFRQGEKWGWIGHNPCRDASPPRVDPSVFEVPTITDVHRLITAAEVRRHEALATFIFLSAFLGCRRGELCALRWSNVDLDNQVVRLWKAIIHIDSGVGWLEKQPKTKHPRTISIEAPAVEAFRRYRQICEENAQKAGTALRPDGFVFPDPAVPDGSEPWLPDQVTNAFRYQAKELDLKIRLHDLRHFSVTSLLAAGVDVKTVADRHGHANPHTTLTVYAHYMEAADRGAAAVMGELMAPTQKELPS